MLLQGQRYHCRACIHSFVWWFHPNWESIEPNRIKRTCWIKKLIIIANNLKNDHFGDEVWHEELSFEHPGYSKIDSVTSGVGKQEHVSFILSDDAACSSNTLLGYWPSAQYTLPPCSLLHLILQGGGWSFFFFCLLSLDIWAFISDSMRAGLGDPLSS